MKVTVLKVNNYTLSAADDMEAAKLERFKTGDYFDVDIKLGRNPKFHGKVFAFFRFCFAHWKGQNGYTDFMDENAQFEVFRNHLTCLAGYYVETFNIKGDLRIEAQSLSYSNMEPDVFEQCYNALIRAAQKNIFRSTDQNTYDQLASFF